MSSFPFPRTKPLCKCQRPDKEKPSQSKQDPNQENPLQSPASGGKEEERHRVCASKNALISRNHGHYLISRKPRQFRHWNKAKAASSQFMNQTWQCCNGGRAIATGIVKQHNLPARFRVCIHRTIDSAIYNVVRVDW